MTLRPVSRVMLGPTGGVLVDVTAWVDRAGYKPAVGDLGGLIATAELTLVNPTGDLDGVIARAPSRGLEVGLYDPLDQLVFGGWIANPVESVPGPGTRAWHARCQSWAARVAETSTGSLNMTGVVDSDRNFLIAMFRDALEAEAAPFGADTVGVDDAIVTVNEDAGWPLVQATAQLSGGDWSYQLLLNSIRSLQGRLSETSLRIRPDKLVEWGVLRTPAPFVLAGFPSAARFDDSTRVAELVAGSWTEEWLTAGHFNRVRLGGAGAAETIALDPVSLGRYGRVRNAPYRNDEDTPAADVERLAYAKLARYAERRRATAAIYDDGLEEGMVVRAVVDELGAFEDVGAYPETLSITVRSEEGEPVDAYRGEFVVQRVEPTMVGPDVQGYRVELGAYVPTFDRAIAELVGGQEDTV